MMVKKLCGNRRLSLYCDQDCCIYILLLHSKIELSILESGFYPYRTQYSHCLMEQLIS